MNKTDKMEKVLDEYVNQIHSEIDDDQGIRLDTDKTHYYIELALVKLDGVYYTYRILDALYNEIELTYDLKRTLRDLQKKETLLCVLKIEE